MLQQVLDIFLTALLTSAMTWGFAYLWFKLRFERRFQDELKAEAEAHLKVLLEQFEARVKSGVQHAGIELLPQLRQQVAAGFGDALKQSPGTLMEGYARAVAKGADLVSDGLTSMLGIGNKR